jgi:hypothetical protein
LDFYKASMFEGKPPRIADALPLEEPQDGESLRPLSWGDLVARLEAARGLRASFMGGTAAADASFDAGSARCIAAHHNGKHPVNLEDSTYRKGPQGIADAAVHGAASGVARD